MKNICLRVIVISLFTPFCLPLNAGGVDASVSLYSKIEGIESLVASFEQTVKDHEGFAVQKAEGKLKLARPNKVYWETFSPYEQIVVGNEQNLWVYDPDLEQVTVQPSAGAIDGPLALLSESLEELQAKYNVELIEESDTDQYILQPQNSDKNSSFARLSFVFEGDVLSMITVTDKLRQTTEIALTELLLNTSIPDQTFIFEAPKGVDIVVNEQ